MRIVCDTNVLISGILVGGHARMLVRAALQNRVENCISPDRLNELRDVLGRRKFHVTTARATAITELAAQTCTVVTPTIPVRTIVDDPDDNAVLEAALAADARYIVSGDAHLLRLGTWRTIAIVTPHALVDLLGLTQ
jgi:putative PIN family toxin of toxin-antitoxin system